MVFYGYVGFMLDTERRIKFLKINFKIFDLSYSWEQELKCFVFKIESFYIWVIDTFILLKKYFTNPRKYVMYFIYQI